MKLFKDVTCPHIPHIFHGYLFFFYKKRQTNSNGIKISLLVGIMTLIDRKKPSLEVAKKCPITVSSVMVSMVTKTVQKQMDTICERVGFYGPVQYGFRLDNQWWTVFL